MSRLQKIAVWKTPDGVYHEDLGSAQASMKRLAYEEAVRKLVEEEAFSDMCKDDIIDMFIKAYEPITAAMKKAEEEAKVAVLPARNET